MTSLFSPIEMRGVTARNRLWMSPMCMYQAEATGDRAGVPTSFHLGHHAARAAAGLGLSMVESTAVSPEGRETPHDLGLWNDAQQEGLATVAEVIAANGSVPGIQLGHAGRKASSQRPWEGDGALAQSDGGWETVAPSPVPFGERPEPAELSRQEIKRIVDAFAAAARRAKEAGFQVAEIHGAHGYLIHEFLSPLSNLRDDEYGGDFEGRTRFAREVITAVRDAWPEDRPLFFRLSATDWITESTGEQAWTPEEATRFARLLPELGVDLLDVSSGGLAPDAVIPDTVDYQARLAAQIREATTDSGLLVSTVGRITEPAQADRYIRDGVADAAFIGRQLLRSAAFAQEAAEELGAPVALPPSYAWAL